MDELKPCPFCVGGEIMQQGRKEAIEAWNRRAEDENKV